MARIIEIPNIGEVEFPDAMTDEQVTAAIQKLIGAPPSQSPNVAPQQPCAPKLFAPRTRVAQDKLPFESIAEMGATPSAALVAGTQTDKKAAIKEFAKARGIPESKYRIVGNDIVYQADDGKFYAEVPGIFKAPTTSIAYNAPDVLEALPSIATGIATIPMLMGGPAGAAGSAALTGTAAAGANLARQKIAGLLSEEDRPINVPSAIGSGLLDAATQLIPAGRLGLFNRRTATDIAKLDPFATQQLANESQRLGIQLTPAELTNLPSLKSQQKVLGNIPESSDTLTKFYEKRYREQIQPAVDDFLGTISNVSDPVSAGFKTQSALKEQIQSLKNQRDVAVKPLYDDAFTNAAPVNTMPIVSQLDRMLEIAKGEEKRELLKIKDMMFREVTETLPDGSKVTKEVLDDRLPALQRVKFSIDSALSGDALSSMDKTIKGEITGIKTQLVDAMSDTNPAYKLANEAFEKASLPINEFMARRTGLSLTEVSQDNLGQFATRIFKDADAPTVSYVRKQVEAANPEAWKDVTRAWLQQNWDTAMSLKPGARDLPIDSGASWKNMLLGSEKSKKVLQAALDPQEYKALLDLTEVLGAAGRVKKLGSDTAFNQKVLADMGDQASGLVTTAAKVAGNINIMAPLKFVSDWATKREFAKNADSIANIITSPDGMSKLRELRKMSPTSVGFWSGLSQLAVEFSTPPVEEFFTDYGYVQ